MTAEPTPPDPGSEESPPKTASQWRWLFRLLALAAFFYLLGYFSHPVTTSLMCKVYG